LTCGRKAGFDPEALLQSAPEAIARLGENRWVLAALGWVWRTLARDRAERGDGPGALSAVFRALRSARQGRDPGVLLACLAADLNRALDVLRQPRNPDRTMGLQELARLLRENSALFLEHLPAEPDGRGPARSAALERFGYLCRRVGESTADEALIEATMQPLAERYPDNPWFAAARVRAAVWRNALDEARQRGRDAAERLADHWALAAARAEAERAAQNPERADKILTRACLGATQPWPWRALAKLALERDQPERAARLLACALAFHDREDPGKVWRLHLRRAQALDAIGDAEAAARETWLAAEARRRAGWNEGRELEAWCADRRAAWRPILDQLDAAPAGQVRRRALAGYREQLTATRREHARPAAVTRYDPERGFGFAQLEDGRQAFLHRSVVRDRTVTAGQRLQVVLVRSFDRKKERLGWKVAWFEPAGAGQEGPAAVA
jgi:predicted Zn-dependent protease/cold shock CspA family protein